MPAEFTGEQKLRIVLESIIRGVPKEEQCKKYAITPEQFEDWHNHLIKNGGKIYEHASAGKTRSSRTRKVKYIPWYFKLLLFLSVFSNLATGIIWGVWYFSSNHQDSSRMIGFNESELTENLDTNRSEDVILSKPPSSLDDLIEQVDQFGKENDQDAGASLGTPSSMDEKGQDLDTMLAPALKLPQAPSSLELENRVDFLDEEYEAKHVVYVIDVGSYQLKGPNAIERLESMKLAVLESLTKLSSNSYFNLVLCWNLREAHALGKTILRANDENKRYATEWVTSLGNTPDLLKEGRNQFYPKELLYAQVLPGVIGPWYGLATAVSYDPDVIFFLAGNMPDFSPEEVSRNDYHGLGMSLSASSTYNPKSVGFNQGLSYLIRKTAGLWLVALQSERNLPDDQEEIEDLAIQRLSLDSMDSELIPRKFSIPWDKAFDNFLAGLEMGISKIPRVYVFQTLPEHIQWPSTLQRSMEEFCESTRGMLAQFP